LVLAHALMPAERPITAQTHVPRSCEAAALALALCSLLLGLAPWDAYLPVPAASSPFTLAAFSGTLWPILGGGVLAILLGRWNDIRLGKRIVAVLGPARRAAVGLGTMVERIDGALRHWPAAGLALLMVSIVLGAAMVAVRH